MTPGKYIHIGGDEAHSTSHEDYVAFMNKVQPVVAKYGKTVIGWHQLTGATPAKGALAQYWGYDATSAAEREQVVNAAKNGTKLVLSPADRAYLDMKYNKDTPLGPGLGGLCRGAAQSYDWDPGDVPDGRARGLDPGCRGAAVVGDDLDLAAHRVHGVPAAAGHRRARLVARVDARLGHVQGAARRRRGRAGTRWAWTTTSRRRCLGRPSSHLRTS